VQRENLRQAVLNKSLLLAAALSVLIRSASAQNYPDINVPSADQRRALMLEKYKELQRQRKLDDAYKAARNKIPDQKPNDPWRDVRPPPTVPIPK
jgi:hypothetical protein